VVVTAAACGSSTPSEGALHGKTATAITGIALKAYHQQSSVAFVTKTIVGKTTTLEVGATSKAGDAAETVTANGDPVIDAVLVDHVAYLRASAAVLENTLKLSTSTATTYTGKWISFKEGDAAYQGIVSSLSPTQAIAQFVPEEPNLRVAGATSIGAGTNVAVAGSPAGSLQAGSTATSTLFVSTTTPYLPTSSTIVVKDATGKNAERLASVYGKYNKPVHPIAPKGATPISSITS
jgi:hypothetical protein